MDSMTSQSLHTRQKLYGSFKLGRQNQHLEIQERLLVPVEMTLTCKINMTKFVDNENEKEDIHVLLKS